MVYHVIRADDHLEHHGILGQKWGVRRYQNEDGTLTTEGKARYEKKLNNLSTRREKFHNTHDTKTWTSTGKAMKGVSIASTGLAFLINPALGGLYLAYDVGEFVGSYAGEAVTNNQINKILDELKDMKIEVSQETGDYSTVGLAGEYNKSKYTKYKVH